MMPSQISASARAGLLLREASARFSSASNACAARIARRASRSWPSPRPAGSTAARRRRRGWRRRRGQRAGEQARAGEARRFVTCLHGSLLRVCAARSAAARLRRERRMTGSCLRSEPSTTRGSSALMRTNSFSGQPKTALGRPASSMVAGGRGHLRRRVHRDAELGVHALDGRRRSCRSASRAARGSARRTVVSASSRRSASVKPRSANLVAEYAANPG